MTSGPHHAVIFSLMKNGDQGWWFRSKYSTVLYNPGTAVMVVVVVIPTYRREVGDSKGWIEQHVSS